VKRFSEKMRVKIWVRAPIWLNQIETRSKVLKFGE
jgi:hypothetical protein